ncbi:MAG: hypothetical protein M5U28_19925 [Sandaracinaceae bacterium]|nr:hypothetical protein [Sandaracinaceae bacterium]
MVDATGPGWCSSLALDASGGVHVAYAGHYERYRTGLLHAYRDLAGGWTIERIEPLTGAEDHASLTLDDTSLALDALGGVHVSYRDAAASDLRYAYRSPGGVWTTTTVDADGVTGKDTSIALDASGGVHISYHDATNLSLRYAYRRICPDTALAATAVP